jgi:hypothetical protein
MNAKLIFINQFKVQLVECLRNIDERKSTGV